MKPSARIQTTLELLDEVESTQRPLDAVTSRFFRVRKFMRDDDRGAVLELLYVLLRHRARIGWWLAALGQRNSPRNQMLAWLLLGGARTPDQLRDLFDGSRFAPEALTPQEYRLLAYLAHQRGRVVSQMEIVEHLYAQDFERESNSVEVLVGRVRKRLGNDIILTRRGFGYTIGGGED